MDVVNVAVVPPTKPPPCFDATPDIEDSQLDAEGARTVIVALVGVMLTVEPASSAEAEAVTIVD